MEGKSPIDIIPQKELQANFDAKDAALEEVRAAKRAKRQKLLECDQHPE